MASRKDRPAEEITRPFQLHLHRENVSWIRGTSNNWPTNPPDNPRSDLIITRPARTNPLLTAADDTSLTPRIAAGGLSVQITSYDCGANGTVCAEVTLDDATVLAAHPATDQGGGTCLRVPRDDDNNGIFDARARQP